jgi:hypothetical protein
MGVRQLADGTPLVPSLIYPRRCLALPFMATSPSSLQPGPTSTSTSQTSRAPRTSQLFDFPDPDLPTELSDNGRLSVQHGRPPVITWKAARRQARDSGTLSGTSAEEEQ